MGVAVILRQQSQASKQLCVCIPVTQNHAVSLCEDSQQASDRRSHVSVPEVLSRVFGLDIDLELAFGVTCYGVASVTTTHSRKLSVSDKVI